MLELRQFATVGRSLIAVQQFYPGDVVLEDTAALRFDAAKPLPDEIESLRAQHEIPQVLAAAALAFADHANDAHVMRTLMDMHAPDLPVCKATMQLYAFAEGLVKLRPGVSTSLAASTNKKLAGVANAAGCDVVGLVHATMAAKVNAHRASNGDWCLLPLASKVAHSCSPNLFLIPPDDSGTCRLVATRNIANEEQISFSYLGGPNLLLPAPRRQALMTSSHLFVCQCSRCRHSDYARQLRCPRKCADEEHAAGVSSFQPVTPPSLIARRATAAVVTDADAFPEKLWGCHHCRERFSDQDVKLQISEEDRVSRAVDAIDAGAYKLAELKAVTVEVATVLGYGHHCMLACVGHVAAYFRLMCQNGCGEALSSYVVWSLRYIDLLVLQGVETGGPFCHMLTASMVISFVGTIVRSGESGARFAQLAAQLAKVCQPLMNAAYRADPRGRAVAMFAQQASPAADAPFPALAGPFWMTGAAPPEVVQVIAQWCPEELRPALLLHGRTDATHATHVGDNALVRLFDLWEKEQALASIRRSMTAPQ